MSEDNDNEVDETPPPSFDWNTAHNLSQKGPEFAMVMGLSMISEQLDWIINNG